MSELITQTALHSSVCISNNQQHLTRALAFPSSDGWDGGCHHWLGRWFPPSEAAQKALHLWCFFWHFPTCSFLHYQCKYNKKFPSKCYLKNAINPVRWNMDRFRWLFLLYILVLKQLLFRTSLSVLHIWSFSGFWHEIICYQSNLQVFVPKNCLCYCWVCLVLCAFFCVCFGVFFVWFWIF